MPEYKDVKKFEEIQPYLSTMLAFLLYLCHRKQPYIGNDGYNVADAYDDAGEFVEQLERDLKIKK